MSFMIDSELKKRPPSLSKTSLGNDEIILHFKFGKPGKLTVLQRCSKNPLFFPKRKILPKSLRLSGEEYQVLNLINKLILEKMTAKSVIEARFKHCCPPWACNLSPNRNLSFFLQIVCQSICSVQL